MRSPAIPGQPAHRPRSAADCGADDPGRTRLPRRRRATDGESPNAGAARTVPSSLPNTALWVASAVQRQIAVEELPVIASAIATSVSNKEAHWQHGEQEWVLRR